MNISIGKKEYIYALLAVLLWSTVATAFKITLGYISFYEIHFIALLTSLVTFFIALLLFKKVYLLKKIKKADFLSASVLGFINPFVYYLVLFKSYDLLPAQIAQGLNYTWPITLVLFSVPLLKMKIGFNSWIAIFISFIGVLLLISRGNFAFTRDISIVGILLALGSAVLWAVYWIYNIKDKKNNLIKLFLNFVFGFFYISIYLLINRNFSINIKGLFGAIYIGLFEMGITFILWMKALEISKNTAKTSNLVYLAPVLSLFFIYFVVGENIYITTLLGLIFILSGIIFQGYQQGKSRTLLIDLWRRYE